MTFRQREKKYGIKQVSFAHAVVAQETVEFSGKTQVAFGNVPVVQQRKMFQLAIHILLSRSVIHWCKGRNNFSYDGKFRLIFFINLFFVCS